MVFHFLKAYLFSKRANSHIKKMAWISLSGITLGTFSLIVVLSIMSGLNAATEDRLLKDEPHLTVENADQNFLKNIESVDGFSHYNVFETQDILIKTSEGLFNGAEALGIDEKSLKNKPSFYSYDDSPLSFGLDSFSKGQGVYIGSDLAFELKVVVGDVLEIYKPETILKGELDMSPEDTISVGVAGVLNSESGSRESRLIVYKYQKLLKGKSLSLTSGYEIYLKDPRSTDRAKLQLESFNYSVESWRDRNSSLFLALKLEKLAMTFLLGLALLITSFSIMTLLILIVVQKQKDIGILLSMGLSRNQVRLLFGGIGAGVSVFGILFGGGCGVLVSILLDLFPVKILPPIYQDPYLPADFNLSTVGWVFFFCSFVAVLSSVIPILYISKITPVSALKETSKF